MLAILKAVGGMVLPILFITFIMLTIMNLTDLTIVLILICLLVPTQVQPTRDKERNKMISSLILIKNYKKLVYLSLKLVHEFTAKKFDKTYPNLL